MSGATAARSPRDRHRPAGGFDVMLGNPPWEHVELKEKEWFATRNKAIAEAKTGAQRKKLIAALETEDPPLFQSFEAERRLFDGTRHFLGASAKYPLCGRGRINFYTVFTELFRDSLSPRGRSGCVVPSGIATDDTTKFFFQSIVERKNLVSLFDFENAAPIFPGVHRSYKFCALTLGGDDWAWDEATFAFFLHRTEDLDDDDRVFTLTADDIALVNPNTRTCPIFRTKRDAEITKGIYRRVPVLVDESKGEAGNPWGVTFKQGLFNMTSDSHLFHTREELEADGWTLEGNVFVRGTERMLPLYEGKMIWQAERRFASFDDADCRPTESARLADPIWEPLPRYWTHARDVESEWPSKDARWTVGFRDITNSTNERTAIFAAINWGSIGNKLPILFSSPPDDASLIPQVTTSFAFDYACRQKLGATSMNFFIAKQLPLLSPSQLYAAESLSPPALRFREHEYSITSKSHSIARNSGTQPFRYSLSRRFQIRCELDAAFFHLYGIERDDVDYIMDTFPIVRDRDEKKYGHYRTKDRILQIYDEMAECMAKGEEWQSPLDPPPGDPRACWTEEEMNMWRRGEGEPLIEKYNLLDEALDS